MNQRPCLAHHLQALFQIVPPSAAASADMSFDQREVKSDVSAECFYSTMSASDQENQVVTSKSTILRLVESMSCRKAAVLCDSDATLR